MNDPGRVLLEYLRAFPDAERASSMFADDGVFEMPYLVSVGVEPRAEGRDNIRDFIAGVVELYPDFTFDAKDIKVLIDTPTQAFAEYVAALLIDPVEPNAYMGIGQLYLNAGRHEDAIPPLQRLVALQPAYNEAHYALGTALLRAGRTDEGNRQLAEFTRVQTQRADEKRRTLAVDVLKQEAAARTAEGALDRAEAVWKQVLALAPDVAAHHAALGAVLVRANRLDLAASSYERAAALGGGPDVYRELASIYARLGRQSESVAAREKYERALLVPAAPGAAH